MASVELEHVDKVYPNGAHAVADVSLRVEDGELMVLVGPSGCGKSTVMRLVAGLEDVTAGTVRIGDAVVNALTPQARNVAMVFQDYALYPQMTVRRNLEFPLRMRGVSPDERERQVARIAGLLDLAPLLDRYPRQLSGGQRQRVAMGRALVREPAVSLLDEPLSNLDAKLRVQVRAEIAELQERIRTTMMYVTHDQVEAMTLGHRVAVMDKGRLQQVAAPRELYDAPANVFVAGFIGNPPMNLFATRIERDERGGVTLAIGTERAAIAPEHVTDVLRATVGRAGTAGIRPEHLRLLGRGGASSVAPGPPAADGGIAAVVDHVEWLGHETLAYLHVGAADGIVPLVVRVPGMEQLSAGDTVRLGLDPTRLRLFGEDGRALM